MNRTAGVPPAEGERPGQLLSVGEPAYTGSSPALCPECGRRLSDPISGSVHCYRRCEGCGEEFPLDDPRVA